MYTGDRGARKLEVVDGDGKVVWPYCTSERAKRSFFKYPKATYGMYLALGRREKPASTAEAARGRQILTVNQALIDASINPYPRVRCWPNELSEALANPSHNCPVLSFRSCVGIPRLWLFAPRGQSSSPVTLVEIKSPSRGPIRPRDIGREDE